MGHTMAMRASITLLLILCTFLGARAFSPRVISQQPKASQLLSSSSSKAATSTSNSRQAWRELADPKEHLDFMIRRHPGGDAVQAPRDNLHSHYAYFVRLNSKFVFCFQGIGQVYQCRDYFSHKIHPSTRKSRWYTERNHDDGPWYCRLPKGITEMKRKKILKGLDELIAMHGDDYDFVYHQRKSAHQGFEKNTLWIEKNKKRREAFRQKMAVLLEREKECETPLSDLVWIAVGMEEGCLLPAKSAQSAMKALRHKIVSAEK